MSEMTAEQAAEFIRQREQAAYLRGLVDAGVWQPIPAEVDTSKPPFDGKPIQLEGRFDSKDVCTERYVVGEYDEYSMVFTCFSRAFYPTHWSPLPSPDAKINVLGLVRALQAYETWEAELLMDNAAWENGLPIFTQVFYDRWMELQQQRNQALADVPEAIKAALSGSLLGSDSQVSGEGGV